MRLGGLRRGLFLGAGVGVILMLYLIVTFQSSRRRMCKSGDVGCRGRSSPSILPSDHFRAHLQRSHDATGTDNTLAIVEISNSKQTDQLETDRVTKEQFETMARYAGDTRVTDNQHQPQQKQKLALGDQNIEDEKSETIMHKTNMRDGITIPKKDDPDTGESVTQMAQWDLFDRMLHEEEQIEETARSQRDQRNTARRHIGRTGVRQQEKKQTDTIHGFKGHISFVDKEVEERVASKNINNNKSSSHILPQKHYVVQECVTGDTLGEVSTESLELVELEPLDPGSFQENHRDRQASFQRVFDTRAWGHGWDPNNKGLNASGMGSTVPFSAEMMAVLHATVDRIKRELHVSRVTILDVPCGDMVWMHRFLQTRDDVMYTGMDIVPALIRHHQRTYPMSSYPQRRFIHGDIVTERDLGRYHIVLCRMLMQHLPYFDVYLTLQAISNSGSHYALLTTINSYTNNALHVEDTLDNPGRFRPLNLELDPYKLGPPECISRDGPPDGLMAWAHFIGMWRLPLRVHKWCPTIYKNTWTDGKHTLNSCACWQ